MFVGQKSLYLEIPSYLWHIWWQRWDCFNTRRERDLPHIAELDTDQTSLETVTDSVHGKLINWYYYNLDKSNWEEVVSEDSASTDSVNLISDFDSEEEVDCGLQMDQLAAAMAQLAVAQQGQVEAQEWIAQQQMEAQERMGQTLFQRQAVDNLNKF